MVLKLGNINTAPRSSDSQFSLVKDRISWSKSKYFLLQHSERWYSTKWAKSTLHFKQKEQIGSDETGKMKINHNKTEYNLKTVSYFRTFFEHRFITFQYIGYSIIHLWYIVGVALIQQVKNLKKYTQSPMF